MVAYVNGEENVHNTTCTDDVADGWNRTAYLSAGTATYLGQATDGTYLLLTAGHVTSSGGSITSSDGTTYTFSYAGTSWTLTNSDGSDADLKIIAITPDDDAAESYLQSLGSISIYTGTLTTDALLYIVGTGRTDNVGDSLYTGTRTKQWAQFYANAYSYGGTSSLAWSVASTTSTTTICYNETFTNTETLSFQAAPGDSGSGVFIEVDGEAQLIGVVLAVSANGTSAEVVGYYSEDEDVYCYSWFANLSEYADQINAIMAIPEPSAFSLFAGTAALALACVVARRRRSKKS